ETVVQRIRVVYEQRETAEQPFRELAQGKAITPTFDPRIPLLIYGHKSFDSNGFSSETKAYQLMRTWLARKEHVSEMLPPGPPVLLNALLEWMTITGRAHFIAENIDYLLAVAYVDSKSGFKDSLDLAASFGPEFYQRIMKALQVDGGFINLGFAERVWSVAKRAEAHSWAMTLQNRSDGGWAENRVGEPWSLGPAYVPLMEFYALGHKMRAVQRPATWPATRPLDSANYTRSVWWHEPSMLIFGRHEKPTTTQNTAALRAMELHQSIMASAGDASKKLQSSWQDANRTRAKRSGGPVVSSTAPLFQPQWGVQGILDEPGHSYWTALLSVVSGLKTLVPVFDHPKVPASWPIVKQEGAYLVKIQPFEVSNSMSRALVRVIDDMKRFGMNKQGPGEGQDEMQELMKEAVVMVRGQARRMETDVITPLYDSYQQLAKDHPAFAVFLVVFTLLSIFPVTSFLLFGAIVFGSFIVGAICTAVAVSLGVCAIAASLSFGCDDAPKWHLFADLFGRSATLDMAGGFLLFTLALIFGFAMFVTSTYIFIRLGLRFIFHLYSEEGRGLGAWTQESLSFFNLTSTPPYSSLSETRRGLTAGGEHDEEERIKVEEQRGTGDGSSDEWAAVDPHPAEPQ
ncbi:hypothetical protein FRC01_011498, partial [Tulasnella sp. 417]